MYKYGEKILVRHGLDGTWVGRIFIDEVNLGYVRCVNGSDEEDFKAGSYFGCSPWQYHKSLSEKYDPAEMIGKKLKQKGCNEYKTIINANNKGIVFISYGSAINYTYEMMERDYEVIE